MTDLVAAMTDAIIKRLNGPVDLTTILLLLSIVVSALIIFLRSNEAKTLPGLVCFLAPTDTLTNASARANVLLWIPRKFLTLLVALPRGASIAIACGYASYAASAALSGDAEHLSDHQNVTSPVLFTVTIMLAYGISYHVYQNLQHRIPVLWELRKVHHSAEVIVGTTKGRIHPIHDVMNRVWDGLITGPVYGFRLFIPFDPVEFTILGFNVYVLRIITMDFVRHTHLKVSFGPLVNQIILFLHYHQLHHSTDPKHSDKNFGLMLPIWDRTFATLRVPKPNESLPFGLGSESGDYQSTFGRYVLPLRKTCRLLRLQRAGALPSAAAPVHATTQLGIISLQRDPVA